MLGYQPYNPGYGHGAAPYGQMMDPLMSQMAMLTTAQAMAPYGGSLYGAPGSPMSPYAAPGSPSFMPPPGPPAVSSSFSPPGRFAKCRREIKVVQPQSPNYRFMDMTFVDKHYYEHGMPQFLGFRFSHALDPSRTVQALKLALKEYPVVGSKVTAQLGDLKFLLEEGNLALQLINVSPDLLSSPIGQLMQVCDIMCPRPRDYKQNGLFYGFLFRTSNKEDGSVLIAGFHHVMGDAFSYAMFMSKWSEFYQRLASSASKTAEIKMPEEAFTQVNLLDPNYMKSPTGPVHHSLAFTEAALKTLKENAMQGGQKGEILSTNDLLCAQAACALAPTRFRKSGATSVMDEVRICMLIDFRGLAVPERTFGNRWTDSSIDFRWQELLEGNVLQVARKLRAHLKADTELMKRDFPSYQREKDRRDQRKLYRMFTWNNWSKAGEEMRKVNFAQPGGDAQLMDMRWCNCTWLPTTQTAVVEPMAAVSPKDPKIVVWIASDRDVAGAELQMLNKVWPGGQPHSER